MTVRAIKKQKQNANKDKPETCKKFSRLISYDIQTLFQYNSRNTWCNFPDYFIDNLQTPYSCYESKELDKNNCVEIMGIGVEVTFPKESRSFSLEV